MRFPERPDVLGERIGCSRKVPASVLKQLQQLGIPALDGDDAGRITVAGLDWLASVDLIHPPCRDPGQIGRILFNHCVNDIVCKGGSPVAALSLVVYPSDPSGSPADFLVALTRGIQAACESARVSLLGGHTIYGPETLTGLAVFGTLGDGRRFVPKRGAHVGDLLILTKPLGALYVLHAQQQNSGQWQPLQTAALESMLKPHRCTWLGSLVRSCTDISGFGFAGHLGEMLEDSQIGADIERLPFLEEPPGGVPMCALERNWQSYASLVNNGRDVGLDPRLFAPETAGPLLLAVDPENAREVQAGLAEEGFTGAGVIGRLVDTPGIRWSP